MKEIWAQLAPQARLNQDCVASEHLLGERKGFSLLPSAAATVSKSKAAKISYSASQQSVAKARTPQTKERPSASAVGADNSVAMETGLPRQQCPILRQTGTRGSSETKHKRTSLSRLPVGMATRSSDVRKTDGGTRGFLTNETLAEVSLNKSGQETIF